MMKNRSGNDTFSGYYGKNRTGGGGEMRFTASAPPGRHKRRRATKRFAVFAVMVAILAVGLLLFTRVCAQSEKTVHTGAARVCAQARPPAEAAENPPVEDGRFLVLVNWEHPSDGSRPDTLVPMDEVFENEVSFEGGSIDSMAGAAAREMFRAAQAEGVGPYKITTAYRSIEYQEQLWEQRLREDPDYGREPYSDPVRVLPGNTSEHTTGLALDILSPRHDEADDSFGETPEGLWLAENAWKHGFILRYPEGKEALTGVIYEPWHFRYVGKQAAKEIYQSGQCLEEYAGGNS